MQPREGVDVMTTLGVLAEWWRGATRCGTLADGGHMSSMEKGADDEIRHNTGEHLLQEVSRASETCWIWATLIHPTFQRCQA